MQKKMKWIKTLAAVDLEAQVKALTRNPRTYFKYQLQGWSV